MSPSRSRTAVLVAQANGNSHSQSGCTKRTSTHLAHVLQRRQNALTKCCSTKQYALIASTDMIFFSFSPTTPFYPISFFVFSPSLSLRTRGYLGVHLGLTERLRGRGGNKHKLSSGKEIKFVISNTDQLTHAYTQM